MARVTRPAGVLQQPPRDRHRRRWILLAALAIAPVVLVACGESPEDRRAALRAEAEREFGRPSGEAADTPGDRGTAGAETVTGGDTPTSGATTDEPGAVPTTSGEPPAGETPSSAAPSGPPVAQPAADTPAPSDPGDTGAADPDPVPVSPPSGQEPPAAALLADADEAYSGLASLRAAFVQRVDLPLVDRTAQGHGTWYQEGRDRFRMDFADPPDDVFVADGEFLWLYQPSATPGQVIKSTLGGGGQAAGGADVLARILSEARASYDAEYEGTAIVSGVRCHVIGLTPRGPSDYRAVRVWIADGDRLVRRFRIEEENETIRTVTLADLEPNVPMADTLFSFVAPDDVQVFERGGGTGP